jgi:two-component system nitrogen regulation sensor histidine kinase NtrY
MSRSAVLNLLTMSERPRQPRQRKTPWVIGTLMIASLALLVILQSTNLWKSFSIDTSADLIALYALSSLNFIAFVIFGFIFLRSIIRLVHERRTFEIGAKIKTRLLVYFVAISLLPIIAMAVFSYLFMNRALEKWFSQIPQKVVAQAKEMQQSALEEHTATLSSSAKMLASTLEGRELNDSTMAAIGNAGGLAHVEVLSADNQTLATSERAIPPEQRPDLDRMLAAIRQGSTDEPSFTDRRGYDAAIAPMSGGRRLVIIPDPINEKNVGQVVENSVAELNRLSDQQLTIRRVGLLTLGVLTFLLLFASSWIAFYVARRLTDPVKALAQGAGEIAEGNLGYQVDVIADDELGILVAAFNEMSARLDANAAELRTRRRYIETVLETLPTGVISFDDEYNVTTINSAAVTILHVDGAAAAGVRLRDLIAGDEMESFERLLSRARRVGHASDQIVLRGSTNGDSGRESIVSLTAAKLPGESGVVLVLEDLSQLISAQRASAWQEVARRMAHEIKNPLTPIQLSAERIQKRFDRTGHADAAIGKRINDKGPIGDLVHESTATILREVSSLKAMVDEFSRFARLPEANLQRIGVGEIIRQSIVAVHDRFPEIEFSGDASAEMPQVNADAEQLKRVFINLLDNAAEAFDSNQPQSRCVNISARYEAAREILVVEVSDNGPGLDPASLQKLFQPYFSTKGRGTGLGLAIVNRIIADHKGRIHAAQNQPRGAKFIVELPVAS